MPVVQQRGKVTMQCTGDDCALAQVLVRATAHGGFDQELRSYFVLAQDGQVCPGCIGHAYDVRIPRLAALDLPVDIVGHKHDSARSQVPQDVGMTSASEMGVHTCVGNPRFRLRHAA